MKQHEDGIYIGLPEQDYHNDPALGASGICDLLVSPAKFWRNSPHNPDREEDDTPSLALGSWFHAIMANDTAGYVVKPEGMSFATKEGKAFKAAATENATGEVIFVPADVDMKAKKMIDALHAVNVAQEFEDGLSEVSVFWTEKDGTRGKIRIDRLCADKACDWKTFSNSLDKDFETAIGHAVAYQRYHVRAWWYQNGIEKMQDMLRKRGHKCVSVFGENALTLDGSGGQILENAAGYEGPLPFWFVFVESNAVPEIAVRQFVKYNVEGVVNAYWRGAEHEGERALASYRSYVAANGFDQPWLRPAPLKRFTDEDFQTARWILEEI